jgi:divalent metal cation (Fe/Co/Zn/Cd) transporter
MVRLLREMPTQSSAVLADACNRCLDRFTSLKLFAARRAAVDPDDGPVTYGADEAAAPTSSGRLRSGFL